MRQIYAFPLKYLAFFIVFVYALKVYAGADTYQPLLLLPTINQQALPDSVLFIQNTKDNQILANLSFFKANGIRAPMTADTVYNSENYYKLHRLTNLTYQINLQNAAINIQVPITGLVKKQFILSQSQKSDVLPKSKGAYLNYSLSQQYLPGIYSHNGGFFEAVYFNRYGVGNSSFLLSKRHDFEGTRDQDQQVLRLTSNWTYDMPDSMRSLRLGDITTSSGSWGQSVMLGGIQLATNFATQPGFITFPMPAVHGEAVVPSSVNLYVNNVLVNNKDINRGPFDILNIPVVDGYGNIDVVTTNLLGQKQITTVSYYNSSVLLKSGLQNYSYEAGYIRNNYGMTSNSYKRFAAVGTHALGINDHFTVQGHAELQHEQQNIGIGANYLVGYLGVANLGAAVSRSAEHKAGGLVQLGFQHQGFKQISYGFNAQLTSADFTQLGYQAQKKPPKLQWQSSIGIPLHDGSSLGLSYTRLNNRSDEPNLSLLNLSYNRTLNSFTSFNLSGITNLGGYATKMAFLNFIFSLGNDKTLNTGAMIQAKDNSGFIQLNKSLPTGGTGYGYNLKVEHSQLHGNDYYASVLGQNRVGFYSAKVASYKRQTAYELTEAGSIIWFDKQFYLSRQIMNSFGLVKTGIPNISVYSFNQLIGKTNSKGYLLVPSLVAYQNNKVNIDANTVPLDVTIDKTQLISTPYYRSGEILQFPLHYSHAALMNLVLASGQPVPAGAMAYLNNIPFAVGSDGRLYITDLKSDQPNQITVTWDEASCKATLSYQKNVDLPIANLGTITCVQ